MEYYSLDLETTGTNPLSCLPIEIGIIKIERDRDPGKWPSFRSLIGWPEIEEAWSVDAQQVHHLEMRQVKSGPWAKEVIHHISRWIAKHSEVAPTERILIGWKIGSFDMAMLHNRMPALLEGFSYRHIDLNSVLRTLAEAELLDYEETKANLKGRDLHHALPDAEDAAKAWLWMIDFVKNYGQG